jgi:sugar/nucleoside kinase (ribokinase family)
MARIVCLGSALQDVYLKDRDDFGEIEVDGRELFANLELGQKVDIDSIYFSTGGGATNAAVNFVRGDHEAIFIGSIGRDPAGRAVLDLLDKEGIDTSYIHYAPKLHTGYSVLLLAPGGERTVLTYRGASARFDMFDPADLDLISPDWLYVTNLHGDMQTLYNFFNLCAKRGIKIMWNPGKLELAEQRKLLGLLEDVEVLLVNKSEAQQIVPGVLLDELLSHLKNLVPTVIITDGSMGAIAASGEKTYRIGLYDDVKIKDSTGAGDAFGSGFLSALAAGKSFRAALHFASANSTSVVQKIGAKSGILPLDTKLHPMPIQEL